MNRRLPPQPNELIDRNQLVTFRFEGHALTGYYGDTLSSALYANGVRMMGRSFKYHRPRSIYSLAGHDANVIVEDVGGHRTNLRGDRLLIEPGLDVLAVNTSGSLARDRMRITECFSAMMPVGFYYKAFHTPRSLFPIYERMMRRAAGLGRINPNGVALNTPKDYGFCELLVIGAGPAGLCAAVGAAEQGVDVLLVDDQPRPGGSFNWQLMHGDAVEHRRKLLTDIRRHQNITVRLGTQAAGCYSDSWVALVDDQHLTKLRAQAVVFATGCYEQPAVFANNDLPGIMLASAAQRLIHLYAIKPFDRAVVLTANDDGYRSALDLSGAGVEVAAVLDLRSNPQPTELSARLVDSGVRLLLGHSIYEAEPTRGKQGVQRIVACPVDPEGHGDPSCATVIECDGVAVSVGWMPASGLVSQAGGGFRYAAEIEQLVPDSLPSNCFAAGRLNGVFDLPDQLADGTRTGQAAAAYLGKFSGEPGRPVDRNGPVFSHPYPIVVNGRKKSFVDLDEDLHLKDFINAHQEGYDSIELLKRYTTVGMGPSQGKLANMNAVRLLAKLNGRSIAQTGTTTSRPFHQPVALSHLAGRRFTPVRRTPLHAWHEESGAVWMHAGDWLRPDYYQVNGQDRGDCILGEAENVRQNVGVIDVSTLGKVHVCGPDAAGFLERIYTGRYVGQAKGRLRYVLACDETGVIIEDGVAARLADEHFYVTTTSSGAGAFYQEMQRWQILWGMNVVLSNVTGQMVAMNIAGPRARQVLADLADIDISADAFGYLGVFQGTVAQVPAIVMRVGFVGELGYEIHVPASQGLYLWRKIMQAGGGHGIRPFGVEAQRLLRLEKGHLIVSQDTDALTTPYEANCSWAMGRDKSFYVGQRSLQILQNQSQERVLTGLCFDDGFAGSLPKESHLIFDGPQIVGRVTSIAPRTTLGYPIALAFVHPESNVAGEPVMIRVDDGSMIRATVTSPPFYDSENARQG